jgi:hypothetical protein
MASTYVNDLRLNELGTGDGSGTWGTTTNTNFELIAEGFGFGTEAITSNADTHSSVVADGSTDPVRNMYIKYTGALDSDCTITITPNTMSRVHFIENATTDSGSSGPYNIIISQGSGANITIPNGDTKVVYLDGAGSGAAVVDAFASLSTVDLKVQDDLTVTDDAAVGGALTVTGLITGNANLTLGGTTPTLTIGDAGAEDTKLVFDGNAQDFYVGLDDSADDLVIGKGSTVGTTPALSIDENLLVTVSDDVKVAGRSIGTITTDNDGSFDLAVSNDFKCTPSGNFTLTFTNGDAGQSGNIFLINSGGHTVSAHADIAINATALTALTTAGTYHLAYFCSVDSGTANTIAVSVSGALT